MRGRLGARRMSAGAGRTGRGLSEDPVPLAGDEVKADRRPDD